MTADLQDSTAVTADSRRKLTLPRLPTTVLVAVLALSYVGCHMMLIHLSIGPARTGANDLQLYSYWLQIGYSFGAWPAISIDWVYPVGALGPLLIASVFGLGEQYIPAWCLMVALINLGVASAAVATTGVRRAALPLSAWFVFLMLLGPSAIARLDAVMMPLVLLALLLCATWPRLASVLITISAWIKVAGGVAIIPLFMVQKSWRERLLRIVAPAALTCAAVATIQWLAGGNWRTLTSFITVQNERNLQVEAVLAMPAVLDHAAKGEQLWNYNQELGTSETWGPWADWGISVSNLALPAIVIVVAVLTYLARRQPVDALLLGVFSMLVGMIVAHKVGSPQFMAWTAPAVVVAICFGRRKRFWVPVGLSLIVASGITGQLYPWGYIPFLNGEPTWLAAWVLRNLILIGALIAGIVELALLAARDRRSRLTSEVDLPAAAASH
jgi:hypothetical protein